MSVRNQEARVFAARAFKQDTSALHVRKFASSNGEKEEGALPGTPLNAHEWRDVEYEALKLNGPEPNTEQRDERETTAPILDNLPQI